MFEVAAAHSQVQELFSEASRAAESAGLTLAGKPAIEQIPGEPLGVFLKTRGELERFLFFAGLGPASCAVIEYLGNAAAEIGVDGALTRAIHEEERLLDEAESLFAKVRVARLVFERLTGGPALQPLVVRLRFVEESLKMAAFEMACTGAGVN